jgi:DNA-binding NarL/FixJ family response regulator
MTVSGAAGTIAADAEQDGVCRILVVDGQLLFREALRILLGREKRLLVVGDTANGAEALELIGQLQPHVVISDPHSGAGFGVQHLDEIHARFPGIALLVLTAFRAHDVAALVKRVGAAGYLPKSCGPTELLKALREVAAGRSYRLDTGRARRRALAQGGTCGAVVDLTERQRLVLRALALGYCTRETARMLGVSVKAVQKQRERIREVLRLDSIAALTRFAAHEGVAE